MIQKRATLKDIAETLHVSITTVYRALNNHPDISKKLKEQVLFTANMLHYRPNFFAASLRKKHTGLIGVIIPKVIHHFSSTIISGILNATDALGYQAIIAESNNDFEKEKRYLYKMVHTGVDGILIAVSNNTYNEEHLEALITEGIPYVFFDKVSEHIEGHKILTNDYKGAFQATEHLIKQGYTRIAHLKGQNNSRNTLPRFKGYQDALKKYHLEYSPELVKECKTANEEEGFRLAISLMKLTERPDAIFAINDETAIGALSALIKLNIVVPKDVGIVGYCNSKAGAYTQPPLTSVDQFGFDIGKQATETLLDLIKGKDWELNLVPKTTVLTPKLIIRQSSIHY